MNIEFVADKITCEINTDEGGYYMVGFSDNGDSPEQYVIVARAIEFNEQDIELGMDTYYFEYSDQSYSGYGVCKSVKLGQGNVFFDIKENALDRVESIRITFDPDGIIPDRNEFETAFNKIFSEAH